MSGKPGMIRHPSAESVQRLRAETAEFALAEAHELIAELHEQLTRANAAAMRMAAAAWTAARRLAA